MQIILVPYSLGGMGKSKDSEKAPAEIVKALKGFSCNEDGKQLIYEIKELKTPNDNISEAHAIMQKEIPSKDFIALGGDHSITYSAFKRFASGKQNPGIVVFDAHPDLMEGELPTHDAYLRMLIDEGIVKAENVLLVGIRKMEPEEIDFMKTAGIKNYPMKEISMDGIEEVSGAVMSVAKDFSDLYVSVDIDVADPAFAPATSYPEAGGMTARELIYFIQRLKILKNFNTTCSDVVEAKPEEKTIMLAAKVVTELLR